MLNSAKSKSALRSSALRSRDDLRVSHRSDGSDALGKSAAFCVEGQCFATYHAIGSEIDPTLLMNAMEKQGARLALPVLLDRQTMVFRRWDRSQNLVPVGFGTLGPDADQPVVLPDLIFAPLAAFSATGQRIGYGKGHYDRAISKMHAAEHIPALVGLAFESQEVLPFEVETHDIPLDAVLTPAGLRIFEHGHGTLAPFLANRLPANQRR